MSKKNKNQQKNGQKKQQESTDDTGYEFSPPGIGKWVFATQPQDSDHCAEGQWSTDLYLSGDEAEEFKAKFVELIDARVEELNDQGKKARPNYEHTFLEDGTESSSFDPELGDVMFKFRQNVTIVPRDKKKNPFKAQFQVVDKNGNDWDPEKLIGNGSTIVCAYTKYVWGKGGEISCKLRFGGVQVIEHIPYEKPGNPRNAPFGNPAGAINFNAADDDEGWDE